MTVSVASPWRRQRRMEPRSSFSAALCALALGACQSEAGTPARTGTAASGSSAGGSAGSTTGGSGSPLGGSAGDATSGASATGGGGGGAGGGGGQAGSASSAGSGGSGGSIELPPLEECQGRPSLDRLTSWQASGEGTTVPATGSILVMEGGGYVGKVQFVGAEWHVIPVLIANQFGETADLSSASGFVLTYSATSELHVQLRTESHWSGGNQYATTIPSTGGEKQTRSFSFEAANWASLFGAPELSYADSLKEGMGLVFVGNSDNTVVFYGLRIDGYTPPCP